MLTKNCKFVSNVKCFHLKFWLLLISIFALTCLNIWICCTSLNFWVSIGLYILILWIICLLLILTICILFGE